MFWLYIFVGCYILFLLYLLILCRNAELKPDNFGEGMDYKSKRKEIEAYIKKKNSTLTSDKHFNGGVKIDHLDGSILRLENAFLEIKGNFIAIFTEHLGNLYFDKEDLKKWEYEEYKEFDELS
jgi:hypothetical protein